MSQKRRSLLKKSQSCSLWSSFWAQSEMFLSLARGFFNRLGGFQKDRPPEKTANQAGSEDSSKSRLQIKVPKFGSSAFVVLCNKEKAARTGLGRQCVDSNTSADSTKILP